MKRLVSEIRIRAPVAAVYEQWLRFEEFPRFMKGVKEVRRLDEQRLFWRVEILGQDIEWEARVTETSPQRRIAWESVTGHPNRGSVEFTATDSSHCLVKLTVEYQPLGMAETIGDAFGVLVPRVERDLMDFRDFMERQNRAGG